MWNAIQIEISWREQGPSFYTTYIMRVIQAQCCSKIKKKKSFATLYFRGQIINKYNKHNNIMHAHVHFAGFHTKVIYA